jgi:hypothetical protein
MKLGWMVGRPIHWRLMDFDIHMMKRDTNAPGLKPVLSSGGRRTIMLLPSQGRDGTKRQ